MMVQLQLASLREQLDRQVWQACEK